MFCFSQCLGSVLCGEIHCRLLTCCFFIFSVWAPVCVFECVYGKARGQDFVCWDVKSGRKIRREGGIEGNGRGFKKNICFEFKKERKNKFKCVFLMSWGSYMNTRSPLAKPKSRELIVILMYSPEANRIGFHSTSCNMKLIS